MKKKYKTLICVVINVLIVVSMVTTLYSYINGNVKKDKQKNEETLLQYTTNVTSITEIYFTNHYGSLVKSKEYLETIGASNLEVLNYLNQTNNDKNITFQVVECETKLCYYKISNIVEEYEYKSSSYEQITSLCDRVMNGEEMESNLNATAAFTNPINGSNSIAFYTTMDVMFEGVEKKCLLFAIHPTANLLQFLPLVPYDSAEGAIIDSKGSYVVSTSSFKSQDIYEFFRIYNELEYGRVDEIRESVLNNDSGQIYLDDAREQERLFSYKKIPGSDGWIYVSSVLNDDLS